MNARYIGPSTVFALVALAPLVAGCSAPASPTPPAPPGVPRVVASFTGTVDAATGTFRIERDGSIETRSAFVEVPVVQDGVPGSGPASTVELVTEGAQTVASGCGAFDALEGTIRLRSFYADMQLRNVYVELTNLSATGREACNSATAVAGVSDAIGLWSYGNLAPASPGQDASRSVAWRLRIPDSTPFTFRGRVLADLVAPVCDPAFPNPPLLATQSGPYGIAAADLGGDGIVDLVVANSASNSLTVLNGTGRGLFAAPVRLQAGSYPVEVVLADLDGVNGKDVLVVERDSSGFRRYLRQPDGSFGPGVSSSVGSGVSPQSLAAADLDHDGDQDVVVTATYSGALGMFANDGTGSFGAMTSVAIGAGTNPYAVALGDVDGDGWADAVVANAGKSTFSVLLNTRAGPPIGSGTFAAPVTYANGHNAQGILLHDLDGDGDLDLVVVGLNDRSVQVHLNAGGAFTPGASYTLSSAARGVAAGDVDGDGIMDLVLSQSTGTTAVVLRGLGDATFAAPVALEVGQGPYGVTLADLNGDGRLDLATANNGGGNASVLLGRPGGLRSFQTYAGLTSANDVVVADLNGDGRPDLAVSTNTNVNVFLNQVGGALAQQAAMTAGSSPYAIAAADLDGDGDVDLAVANVLSHNVSVLRNQGNGSFSSAVSYPTGVTGALTTSPRGVAIGDFTGDGRPDLAVPNFETNQISVTRNLGFGAFSSTPTLYSGCTRPIGIAGGDVDRDGRVDVVATCNLGTPGIAVFRNGGAGLTGPVLYAVASVSGRPTLADLDGDGWLDVVVPVGTNAAVLRNRGDGTFELATTVTVGATMQTIQVGDVDRDGIPDLVMGIWGGYGVNYLRGLGGMTFAAPIAFATRGSPYQAALVDLDGDTRLDLAVASSTPGTLDVLPGLCLP